MASDKCGFSISGMSPSLVRQINDRDSFRWRMIDGPAAVNRRKRREQIECTEK